VEPSPSNYDAEVNGGLAKEEAITSDGTEKSTMVWVVHQLIL